MTWSRRSADGSQRRLRSSLPSTVRPSPDNHGWQRRQWPSHGEAGCERRRVRLQITSTTRKELKVKTKLHRSKNSTTNKPERKRQGIKVRTAVTRHAPQ